VATAVVAAVAAIIIGVLLEGGTGAVLGRGNLAAGGLGACRWLVAFLGGAFVHADERDAQHDRQENPGMEFQMN